MGLNFQANSQIHLKNTTDSALSNYPTSSKFRQSHRVTNVRLCLGYTVVIIATINFGLDFKLVKNKIKDPTL